MIAMNKAGQIIAFDFDGVFVNHPPLIPKALIESLYKVHTNRLAYRFPNKIEQKIRVLSHYPNLRPSIKINMLALPKISKTNNELLLISSRFSFLKGKTESWDKKNHIFKFFRTVLFNYNDKQPHIFKDEMIKKEKVNKFIDDDLDLLIFLSEKNPQVEFFWLEELKKPIDLPSNVIHINNLEEFYQKYL